MSSSLAGSGFATITASKLELIVKLFYQYEKLKRSYTLRKNGHSEIVRLRYEELLYQHQDTKLAHNL